MAKYAEMQERIREEAIEWQMEASEKDLSYAELAEACEYFREMGKRYGLLREFHENGIC